jgi:hypothetical protein
MGYGNELTGSRAPKRLYSYSEYNTKKTGFSNILECRILHTVSLGSFNLSG